MQVVRITFFAFRLGDLLCSNTRGLIGTSVASRWSTQTGARCAKRCMIEWRTRIGKSMCSVLREAATKVGIKTIAERRSLLWKLSEKGGAGETYLYEKLGWVRSKTEQRAGAEGLVGSMGRLPS